VELTADALIPAPAGTKQSPAPSLRRRCRHRCEGKNCLDYLDFWLISLD
jgi:hypothetical protein